MLWHRRILLALSVLLVTGSISVTLGYGLYLRSDRYRHSLEVSVSDLLELPVSIGRVRALNTTSRAFYDIHAALPNHNTELFRCAKAVWHGGQLNGRPHFSLDLVDGWLLIGTHQWAQSDYQTVLRSGLGRDFTALNLREVNLDRVDLEWQHPDLTLSLRNAIGQIRYDDAGSGRASLVAYSLNGARVQEPIKAVAHFTPASGFVLHQARLDVPTIPLSHLGLERLLRAPVEHGTFRGHLAYREVLQREYIDLDGRINDARLEELTEPLLGGPFTGRVDVIVDEAVFVDRRLDTLRFHGTLDELDLTQFVPVLRHSGVDSHVRLRVHQAALRGRTIEYLSATGQATGLALETVSRLLDHGTITGHLEINIHSLQIVDDTLQHAEIDVIAIPPDDRPGQIDHELLDWVAREIVGLDLSRMLPKQLEYARLGAKLVVDGGTLRVRGTHGADDKTILTIRVFGREITLVREFDRTFEIGPLLSQLRAKAETYDVEQVRRWWESTHGPPAPPPDPR